MKKGLNEDFEQEKFFDDSDQNEQVDNQLQDDIDPLDAYMSTIQDPSNQPNLKRKREEIMYENEDPMEEFVKKRIVLIEQRAEEQYDLVNEKGEMDDNYLKDFKKRKMQLIPLRDQNQQFSFFNKDFYSVHQEIQELDSDVINNFLQKNQVQIVGENVQRPIFSFAHFQFDEAMHNKIISLNFTQPTLIQQCIIPQILSGLDVIGVAKTGSGKTFCFIWPMIYHIMDQPAIQKGDGPIALIISPTRELAQQTYLNSLKFTKLYNISVCTLLGGENKQDQWKQLLHGVDVIIATPGRLIDLVRQKATNFNRVTYLVIDEADHMMTMGFEFQVRNIVQAIRNDRQIMLFTATMNKKMRFLCEDLLGDNKVVIQIGDCKQANEDVKQETIILNEEKEKYIWLVDQIEEFTSRGKVLIFVNQIDKTEYLKTLIESQKSMNVLVLHGNKMQTERTAIINNFKSKYNYNVLIATDVASRGLDVQEIRTVINFEQPKDIDTHIHRIGRTGRAGNLDGVAYNLILQNEAQYAIHLVKFYEQSAIPVTQELENIAILDENFKLKRMKSKLGFTYAKGKDASRMLAQIVKRGRNTKAGLGYVEPQATKETDRLSQSVKPHQVELKTVGEILAEQQGLKEQEIKIYRDYLEQKQKNQMNQWESRDEVKAELKQGIKQALGQHFKDQFRSGGSISQSCAHPTIKYMNEKHNL